MKKMKKINLALLSLAAFAMVGISSCQKASNSAAPSSSGSSASSSTASSGSGSALDAATVANEKVEKVAAITDIGKVKGTRIFVVGDSTLSPFNDPYYYPRYGYGTKLQNYLNEKKATVVNLAMSGRSSKSFLTEANYQTLVKNIKKGDYLIIGFGHNDEKGEEARYTNPNGSKEEAGSFKESLYTNYVKLAKDKKATPVLCTPIVRRAPGKAYEGSVVHITKDAAGFPGGDYPKAIRELGQETGTLVVDLTAITKERYEKLADDKETAKFHAQLTEKPKSTDNTHLNTYGASVIAFDVINAVKAADKNFAKLVLADIVAPTEDILVKNPDFVVPKYREFTKDDASALRPTTAPWYGTVFGDCGGEEKLANPELYEIKEEDDKVLMHSGSVDGSTSVGKIAAAADGIQFYFQKLPIDKDFTLKAKAKIISVAKNNQVSFGIMVRDDVYIDRYDNSISTNYVAAGPLKIANGEEYSSSWQRLDGTLKETHNAGQPVPAAGQTVDISITKKGNVYTTKYGKDTAEYTVDLKEVDAKNIYVGLFTVRCANIEFSDISLTE